MTKDTDSGRWFWAASDDGNGGRIAWIVDGDGYSIVEYLTVEQAQDIVRKHNQAIEAEVETASKPRGWTDWSVGDWAVGRAGGVKSSGRISEIDDERRLIWVGTRAFRHDQISTS